MTTRRTAPVAAALLGGIGCVVCAAAACSGGGDRPSALGAFDGGHGADAASHDGASTPDVGGGSDDAGDGGIDGSHPGIDATSDGAGGGPEDVTTEITVVGSDDGPLCTVGGTWGAAIAVLTTGAADSTIFGGVTPDELTVAWTSSTGGVVTAWSADRASTGAAFGAPLAIGAGLGTMAMDRVTLSGDGLRAGWVASGGATLSGATRASRTVAFTVVDTEFDALGGGEAPPVLATPLLAGDDSELVYLVTSSSSDYVMHETSGQPWKGGLSLDQAELARSGTSNRRPSGLSLDDLTLFYWDEVSASEKMAGRPVTSQPFNQFVDLGDRVNAAPAASCQRIYYATPAAGGAGAITIVYAGAE
jgi:hypothetical protein